jgi:hypothetical protein
MERGNRAKANTEAQSGIHFGHLRLAAFDEAYPSPERFGLRVTAAKPEYILAMKLKALDRVTADDRDYQDAVGLGVECGMTTIEQSKEVHHRFFGSENLPTTAELRLAGLAAEIRAKLR